jgi:hypothetical protein
MEQLREETSSPGRGAHGAMAGKRAAHARALALVPTIRELRAAGFVSRRALADQLNRRGIPTAHGGSWHYTTVVRTLTRLGLNTSGSNGLAIKRAADARAKALAPTIRELRTAGFVSVKAITHELNLRQMPAAQGGKWHLTSVDRMLHRLERLELSSGHLRHSNNEGSASFLNREHSNLGV